MNVIQILNRLKIKPQKKWGQNFLKTEEKAQKIINQFQIQKNSPIIEIGPGLGILTFFLIEKIKKEKGNNKLILIEKDNKLSQFLKQHQTKKIKLEIYNEDILKTNWKKKEVNKYQIIGNLPYSIATKILKLFLKEREKVISLFFSFPEEIGKKILAKVGEKYYGFLTVFVELFAHVKPKIKLNQNDFYPTPKIKTIFLEFILKEKLIIKNDLSLFIDFLKKCFQYKRKTLINNWKIAFQLNNYDVSKINIFLKAKNFNEKTRAEMCTLKDFKFFFDYWKNLKKIYKDF